MSTDREMLELAAKAAGIDLWHEDVFTNGLTQKVSANGILCWNPLTDDGDALRLAVKIGIGVSRPDKKFKNVRRAFLSDLEVFSVTDDDPYAATRRAIVRVAAEIGRSKE